MPKGVPGQVALESLATCFNGTWTHMSALCVQNVRHTGLEKLVKDGLLLVKPAFGACQKVGETSRRIVGADDLTKCAFMGPNVAEQLVAVRRPFGLQTPIETSKHVYLAQLPLRFVQLRLRPEVLAESFPQKLLSH